MDVAEQLATGLKEFVDTVPALQQHDDVEGMSGEEIVLDPRLVAWACSMAQHEAQGDVWEKITDAGMHISALCKCVFFVWMWGYMGMRCARVCSRCSLHSQSAWRCYCACTPRDRTASCIALLVDLAHSQLPSMCLLCICCISYLSRNLASYDPPHHHPGCQLAQRDGHHRHSAHPAACSAQQ